MSLKRKSKKPKRSTLSNKADRMWSELVRRRGYCEMKQLAPELKCDGPHQACHVVGRRFRSVRWNLDNGLCGCRNHHVMFTHKPEAFFLAVEKAWPGKYQELWDLAQVPWDRDIGAVLARLKEASKETA